MELRATREMRRSEQLTRAMAKKADTAGAPAAAQSAQKRTPADKASWSQQALDWIQEQNQKMWEAAQKEQDRKDHSLSAQEDGKQELDLLTKGLKVLEACRKIAASIMKGDRVPPEDLKYLMDNDPEGYKLAMAMRRQKKDPEDVESVLEDEEKNSGSAEGAGGGGETPEVSAPEASSGGGDASAAAE